MDEAAATCVVEALYRQGEGTGEQKAHNPTGEPFWVEQRAVLIRDAAGSLSTSFSCSATSQHGAVLRKHSGAA